MNRVSMAAPGVESRERVRDQVYDAGFRVSGRGPGVVVKIPGSCFASSFGDWKEAGLCSSSVSQSLDELQRNLQGVAVCSVLIGLLKMGQVAQQV